MSAINQALSGSHDQQSQEQESTCDLVDVAAMFLGLLLTLIQSQEAQLADHFHF